MRARSLVLLCLAAAIGLLAASAPAAGAAPLPRPNIVVILTDDQRFDSIDRMPNLQSRLVDHGITFTNAFHVNPLCCPARASLLTGLAPQRTHVWSNQGALGGWNAFHLARADRSTIPVWLRQAGYRTGGFGKYLNGYVQRFTKPPGWDQWRAFQNGSLVNDNGVRRIYTGYKTDLIAGWAASFIRSTPRSKPLFLYAATTAPHAPATPAARHAEALQDLEPFDSPAFNEDDVSDKPAYVQARPPLGGAGTPTFRLNQYRSLLAVDEAIARIVGTLRDTGRLRNTLILFTSDNGVLWGEHRLQSAQKIAPYEGAVRAPLIVRWDARIAGPRTEARLVSDIDYAPTFAALAGVETPILDGRSLIPLLDGAPTPSWRDAVLIESATQGSQGIPNWCGVRTPTGKYVAYGTDEEELYDLAADPFELRNLAGQPGRGDDLEAGRELVRRLCFPLPPATLPSVLCLQDGTSGDDTIVANAAPAYVCTRGGVDTIQTGPYADTVEAATLDAATAHAVSLRPKPTGPPGSTIATANGNDRIAARNGARDTITCGAGWDRAVVDHFDYLTGCERVERPPASPR